MVQAPVTILGGLPVIAEVWFSRGDGWMTDDDAGVDALFWRKRDGSAGKEVSQKIYDRLDKSDDYWQVDVTDQASEYLAYPDEPTEPEMVPFDISPTGCAPPVDPGSTRAKGSS